MTSFRVQDFLDSPYFKDQVEIVAGTGGLANQIDVPYVHRPGLAMTGFTDFLMNNQFQIFGQTEIHYLRQLGPKKRVEVIANYMDFGLACLIIARNLKIPSEIINTAEITNTPILRSALPTHVLTEQVTQYLDIHFASTATLHSVLVDIHGVGVLLLGRGGIGKSECALDLLLKGHRLVADDMVVLKRIPPGIIRGEPTEVIKYHMEIRGLGVINIKELFGISSIRGLKKVHLVVKLVDWDEDEQYDRIGLEDHFHDVLGVKLPMIILPVAPGRNISAIIEVAAKNHLLKLEGFHAAMEFQNKLLERLDDMEKPMSFSETFEGPTDLEDPE